MFKTADTIILGASSLDRYLEQGVILPGGGSFNVAYHLSQHQHPFLFLTRIGQPQPDDQSHRLFLDFFQEHEIVLLPESAVQIGQSPTIDIRIRADRQPNMQDFVEGIWRDYALDAAEKNAIAQAKFLHTVLVEGIIREFGRLVETQETQHLFASADFLDFRHFTPTRFERVLPWFDLAFIGWQKKQDHPDLLAVIDIVIALRKLAVITFGSYGVWVIDGRDSNNPQRHAFDVTPLPVEGTTIGCGDAFISYFLAEFWTSADIAQAVGRGKAGGAHATKWFYPLPNKAYPTLNIHF